MAVGGGRVAAGHAAPLLCASRLLRTADLSRGEGAYGPQASRHRCLPATRAAAAMAWPPPAGNDASPLRDSDGPLVHRRRRHTHHVHRRRRHTHHTHRLAARAASHATIPTPPALPAAARVAAHATVPAAPAGLATGGGGADDAPRNVPVRWTGDGGAAGERERARAGRSAAAASAPRSPAPAHPPTPAQHDALGEAGLRPALWRIRTHRLPLGSPHRPPLRCPLGRHCRHARASRGPSGHLPPRAGRCGRAAPQLAPSPCACLRAALPHARWAALRAGPRCPSRPVPR